MINLKFQKYDADQKKKKKIKLISIITAVALAIGVIIFVICFKSCNKSDSNTKTTAKSTVKTTSQAASEITTNKTADANDPISADSNSDSIGTGVAVNAASVTTSSGNVLGIDVSKWQGNIDWAKVKASGIKFAMIRIGFRGEDGVIYKDSYADYNIQNAVKNGILVGIYFNSTAISESEASEEAVYTVNAIQGYKISYPVVYDCEGFNLSSSRMNSLTNTQRTNNALAFLKYVNSSGYDAMTYSSTSELENSSSWNTSSLAKYKIWVARYPATTYPDIKVPPYSGKYNMWQYTNKGSVSGISGNVDLDIAYFSVTESTAKNSAATTAAATTLFVKDGNTFKTANDKVTAKDSTNLRDAPNSKTSNIVYVLKNGEFVTRTGISDKGWSKVIYNGQALYCVTSLLTDTVTTTSAATTTTD